MITFFTGAFLFDDDGICLTCHRPHFKDKNYDDDVIAWIDDESKDLHSDGYVSVKGNTATIHIKPERNSKSNIDFLKKNFALSKNSNIKEVNVVDFLGWKSEEK